VRVYDLAQFEIDCPLPVPCVSIFITIDNPARPRHAATEQAFIQILFSLHFLRWIFSLTYNLQLLVTQTWKKINSLGGRCNVQQQSKKPQATGHKLASQNFIHSQILHILKNSQSHASFFEGTNTNSNAIGSFF
jgi:hypothetical protein